MTRRVITSVVFCSALLAAALIFPAPGTAGVRVDIGVVFPPLLLVPAPPQVVVIPGTPVYYPPALGVDIFFYNGYWYRPYLGQWFIAGHFNGPWSFIAIGSVPGVLLTLPPVRHHVLPRHDRLPHSGLRKRFRTWEQDRFWNSVEQSGKSGGGSGKGKHRGHGRGRGWDD